MYQFDEAASPKKQSYRKELEVVRYHYASHDVLCTENDKITQFTYLTLLPF